MLLANVSTVKQCLMQTSRIAELQIFIKGHNYGYNANFKGC